MPISGASSYPGVSDEFINHWGLTNVFLAVAGPLLLPDGTDLAGLILRRGNLTTRRANLQGVLNSEELARAELEFIRVALHARLVQFNEKVRVFHANTKWPQALSELPGISDAPARFFDPLDDVANLWNRLNSDPATTAPLMLLGGYTLAMFVTDVAAMKAAHTALITASSNVRLARVERNVEQDLIYEILKSYREVYPTYMEKTHPLFTTLPRLTPLPGSTPNKVVVQVVWVPALQKARITFTESDDPHLDHFEVRICIGPNYSTDDESIIASIEPDQPRELLTDAGLTAPGSTISVKVYVITTTGNESGSNAVTVAHDTVTIP